MLTLGTEKTTFDFQVEGSETVYHLPLFMALPLAQLREFTAVAAIPEGAARDLAAIDVQLDTLRAYMGEDADKLTAEQVHAIFEAWQGGVDLGE